MQREYTKRRQRVLQAASARIQAKRQNKKARTRRESEADEAQGVRYYRHLSDKKIDLSGTHSWLETESAHSRETEEHYGRYKLFEC